MTTPKTTAQARHLAILDCALKLAEKHGFRKVRRDAVATLADVATGTVSHHYKSISNLHDEIIRAAVVRENIVVLAQGLAENHPLAKAAPRALRNKAAMFLAN